VEIHRTTLVHSSNKLTLTTDLDSTRRLDVVDLCKEKGLLLLGHECSLILLGLLASAVLSPMTRFATTVIV
jgi:hypothetical protein